jgi:hypothetical protein
MAEKLKVSEKVKDTVSRLANKFKISFSSSPEEEKLNTPTETLGAIYKLLVENRQTAKDIHNMEKKEHKSVLNQSRLRQRELIKALSFKPKKQTVVQTQPTTPSTTPTPKPNTGVGNKPSGANKQSPAGKPANQQQAPAKEVKKEAPAKEAPAKEAPKRESPPKEEPKKEAPKREEPKKEAPPKEAPKKEEPPKEAPPKEAPKKEAPKKEAPKKEEPPKEAPKAEKLKKKKPDKKVEKETPAPPAATGASTAAKVVVGAGAVVAGSNALAGSNTAESIAKYESKSSSPRKGARKWKNDSEYNAYNKGTIENKTVGADFVNGESVIDFSQMTIAEYLRRSKLKDENKLFAVGRYQIIPDTMKGLLTHHPEIDINTTTLSPATQDLLFGTLISKSNKLVQDYIDGKNVSRDDAVMQLAHTFASIGVPYRVWRNENSRTDKKGNKKIIWDARWIEKGESYYSGAGGNKAHNSPEEMGAALDRDRENTLKNKKAQPAGGNQNGQNLQSQSISTNDAKQKEMHDRWVAWKNQNDRTVSVTNQNPNGATPVQNTEKHDDRPAILKKAGNAK